jgi:phosphonate transport system substrate-binding protein
VRYLLLLLAFITLGGCDAPKEHHYRIEYSDEAPQHLTRYVIGVHPLHNPVRLHELFQPLMALLGEQFEDVEFRVEASRNYSAYNRKLYDGEFDFAIPNPYQTVQALKHGYRVIGKMADDDRFRGIILVRRDSGIERLEQLRGRKVSFPAPTALAATMMPQWFLHRQGLDVARDYQPVYVGSQESSIMNVYLGNVAAAATWPTPWRGLLAERPELEKALKVRWVTDSLPSNSVMVREDVPRDHVLRVARTLFALSSHERGRRMLENMAITGYVPASDATYESVQRFLERFERELRPLEAER